MQKIKKITQNIYQIFRKFLAYHLNIPFYDRLILNLTSLCNSNCLYCEVKKLDNSQDLSRERILKLIDEAKDLGVKTIYLSGGEPFLHPDFWEIIAYIKSKGLKLQGVTNGLILSRLSADKLQLISDSYNKLQISLDSYKPEVHDYLRGGQGFWQLTSEAIRKLTQYKKIQIVVNTVISQNNIADLPQFVEYCASLGVKNINFQLLNTETNFPGIEKKDKNYLTITKDNLATASLTISQSMEIAKKHGISTNLFSIKHILEPFYLGKEMKQGFWFDKIMPKFSCIEPFTNIFIMSNGNLLPCALTPAVSNIKDQPLKEAIKKVEVLKKNIKQGLFPTYCRACSCIAASSLTYSAILHPIANRKYLGKLVKEYFQN